jgi:HEAT repeat protein
LRSADKIKTVLKSAENENRVADQAEIHIFVQSKDAEERERAAEELKNNFAILKDKESAWDDLIRLTQDKNYYVRKGAARALGTCYSHLPEAHRKPAWDDLIRAHAGQRR